MKILGVVFGTIPTEHFHWQPKLEKPEKSINLRTSRSLSLPGRALIINACTLSLGKLVYLARVLSLPNGVIEGVNALIWPFLRNYHEIYFSPVLSHQFVNTCSFSHIYSSLGVNVNYLFYHSLVYYHLCIICFNVNELLFKCFSVVSQNLSKLV